MQNTEGGRRLNQAVTSTGKAMAQTGKAVGGALTTAKGALSSWWNTVTTTPAPLIGTEALPAEGASRDDKMIGAETSSSS
jgi:hypothetical protein